MVFFVLSYVGKTTILTEYVQAVNKPCEIVEKLETNQTVPDDLEATFILENEDDEADDYKPTTIEVYRSNLEINFVPHNLLISDLSGNNEDDRLVKMRRFFYYLEKVSFNIKYCDTWADDRNEIKFSKTRIVNLNRYQHHV